MHQPSFFQQTPYKQYEKSIKDARHQESLIGQSTDHGNFSGTGDTYTAKDVTYPEKLAYWALFAAYLQDDLSAIVKIHNHTDRLLQLSKQEIRTIYAELDRDPVYLAKKTEDKDSMIERYIKRCFGKECPRPERGDRYDDYDDRCCNIL